MNALPPLPSLRVFRGAPFSGKSNVTAPTEHAGGAVVGEAAATGGATGGLTVGTTAGFAVGALVGVLTGTFPLGGMVVAIGGSGVAVITRSIIHGVCVATRVGRAVGAPELHALKAIVMTMPSPNIQLNLVIFTISPQRLLLTLLRAQR
jgi:hypothetical protein